MSAAVPVDLPLLASVALALSASAVLALSAQTRRRSREFVIDYGVFVVFAFFAVAGIWLFLNRDKGYVDTMLRRYWLAALFAIFVLEGAMLMYFAPSEGLVPAAIGIAQKTSVAPDAAWTYVLIIGTSVVGATIGQYLLFRISKRWGREWLLERPWFRISDENLARFEGWFEKWGLLAIPISNALPFTRGMLTIPAGLADVDARTFVVLSALGTLVFELILAAMAFEVLRWGIV